MSTKEETLEITVNISISQMMKLKALKVPAIYQMPTARDGQGKW